MLDAAQTDCRRIHDPHKHNPQVWVPRIREIANFGPTAGEAQIGWQAFKDTTVEAAGLLEPAFERYHGRNGRVCVQADPRLHRNKDALVAQAVEFDALAKNIIVKIPATKTGIEGTEEATYLGVSINATVAFTVPKAVAVGEAIERALARRQAEGLNISRVGRSSRSFAVAWTTGSRSSWQGTASRSTLATSSGPASPPSSALTTSSRNGVFTVAFSPPRSATTCNGARSSAVTLLSRHDSRGNRGSTPAASTPSRGSTCRLTPASSTLSRRKSRTSTAPTRWEHGR